MNPHFLRVEVYEYYYCCASLLKGGQGEDFPGYLHCSVKAQVMPQNNA